MLCKFSQIRRGLIASLNATLFCSLLLMSDCSGFGHLNEQGKPPLVISQLITSGSWFNVSDRWNSYTITQVCKVVTFLFRSIQKNTQLFPHRWLGFFLWFPFFLSVFCSSFLLLFYWGVMRTMLTACGGTAAVYWPRYAPRVRRIHKSRTTA